MQVRTEQNGSKTIVYKKYKKSILKQVVLLNGKRTKQRREHRTYECNI